MEEIKRLLIDCDKPLEKEQLEKIIYNIFCVIIFAAPIIPEILDFGIYSLKNTIFNFSTIITAISLLVINRKNIKINLYDGILMGYLALVILSTFLTEHGIVECILGTNGRGEGLITILSYVVTFVIFSRGYKHMTKTAKVAIISAIVVGIYSFLQANFSNVINIPFFSDVSNGVAKGTMRNQNFLSSYICIFLPMTCFYYINGTNKIKRALLISIWLFMTLVYAVTLGGYITFVIMHTIIAVFSLVFSKNRKDTTIKIGVLSVVLLATFALMNYTKTDTYQKELSGAKEEVTNLVKDEDEFGTGRMKIWKKAIMVISHNKLVGTGPDSLAVELREKRYHTADEGDILNKYIVDKVHSEPLHIAATTGIPSAITYLILVGIIGVRLLILVVSQTKKRGLNNTMYLTMVLICLASYLMQSVINISVVQVAPLYWAILGTASGIIESEKNKT